MMLIKPSLQMELSEASTKTEKRKRGRPKVDPSLDVWFGVQDMKERKRIQDRLAQRTRRKSNWRTLCICVTILSRCF